MCKFGRREQWIREREIIREVKNFSEKKKEDLKFRGKFENDSGIFPMKCKRDKLLYHLQYTIITIKSFIYSFGEPNWTDCEYKLKKREWPFAI